MLFKKIFSFWILLLFFIFPVKGQDKIIKLSGDTIHAFIVKISPVEITYHNQEFPDSSLKLSTSFVRKIIYADGRQENINHFGTPDTAKIYAKELNKIVTSNEILVRGNSYFYSKGVQVSHYDLEKIYRPLHDSLLNVLYYQGIDTKQTSALLKFAPIPMGAIGYALIVWSSLPTNLGHHNRTKTLYGNSSMVVPGMILLGSALMCGIGGVISHRCYKASLKKAANRYNKLISIY